MNIENKIKKLLFTLVIALSVSNYCLYSQNKTIKGRIIDDNLEPLPYVSIRISDTLEIGKTDLNGFFQIDIPVCQKEILFRYVGMDPTTIELVDKCNRVDVVMMLSGTYDFITLKRADRKRKKRYKKLPEIHKQAFEKNIFETEHACYRREFEPFYLQEN
ncbi:carboxypeptidase-like regulatory domain-containing protein [Galbibacter sp. EGI 63066]|uniref:carboxypeptidase-like regulatory domain-containing protein n=1 Tax=Galbibacter sp. EGI 63066 TaxID=2993559 RepID=UPI002248CD3D|nr:carboxypeptidase-like regulatory domain-containing protein [Galbibacter sp. EGI 63066]MCX2682162.1 carboxypeptidase-like regulatory domain-containing protein [Galbibacter sp. EGI 63066]